MQGTDFTDCPATALSYASGPRGVLLIVEVPADKVTEELWFDTRAKRLMVWGRFEEYIVASIPAKDLRKEVRKRQPFGSHLPVEYFIEKRLAGCHAALTEPEPPLGA